ncbi:hypothetical protein EJ08DRAFT_602097 [Tothia fuscella]|uniref:Glycosyltransferase family 69 protein n=1 Tax=Tothia fuscella TaxID=1048955 RepID=A0A9P4U3R1_9PEZI|nr:hypothetical protein EJ08DRAFT_602097 [Tothia fuscella]
MVTHRRNDESQRLVRDSFDSTSSDFELDDFLADDYKDRTHRKRISLSSFLPWRTSPPHSPRPGRWRRLLGRTFTAFAAFLLILIIATPFFNPSYSRRPPHYTGSNPNNEKVFIAANIVDVDLIKGPWGKAVIELVDLLGSENVFLSIYENDSGEATTLALQELGRSVKCKTAIISDHIDLDSFPSVQILPNNHLVKRIQYLAQVRNMAIEPLNSANTDMGPFDKLLFINDVVFSPADAADLLFATNIGKDGRTQYHAACAMDFINPFKFYDTFATRDSEGYGAGVPFYPWFSKAGSGISRSDVQAGKDAVRVKSCWGGMTAFEAKWFARNNSSSETNSVGMTPIQFRASEELFWDASECCLVHADLSAMASLHPQGWRDGNEFDGGFYINPYVRVAYDERTFGWLNFIRRFEKLFSWPQGWINWLASRPAFQPRRDLEPGVESDHREWIYDGPTDVEEEEKLRKREYSDLDIRLNGHWETVKRIAKPGGFCGNRQLLVLKKHRKAGERMWERIGPPPGANDA